MLLRTALRRDNLPPGSAGATHQRNPERAAISTGSDVCRDSTALPAQLPLFMGPASGLPNGGAERR
jgi:hypothetical protein